MKQAKPKTRNFINRNVSFSQRHFDMLEVAEQNGYDRSNVVRLALDHFAAARPDFFLPSSYTNVEKPTSADIEAAA